MNTQQYKHNHNKPLSPNILSKIHYAISHGLNVSTQKKKKSCLIDTEKKKNKRKSSLIDDYYTAENKIREYEELVNDCELQKTEATIACLEEIQDNVILYLDQNLNCYWRHGHHGISCCRCNNCGYEDWIKHCHPENVRRRSSKSIKLGNSRKVTKIDERFYLKNSDHREVWNTCIEACGFQELKVSARRMISQQTQHQKRKSKLKRKDV